MNSFFIQWTKPFTTTRTLLFDGEPGLNTATARQAVHKKFNIKLHADPLSKRNMAECAIRGKFV